MLHYFVPASLNDSQTQHRGVRAKRTKPMNTQLITFEFLIKLLVEKAATANKPPQSVNNLTSALRAFMNDHGLSESSAVGSVLRISYYRRLQEHIDSLVDAGRDSRYIANRKSLLAHWHSMVLELDREYAASSGIDTPFQKAIKELVASAPSQRRLAKETGVPLATLKRWLAGTVPQKNALSKLRRLEAYFGATPGLLVELATNKADQSPTTIGEPRDIAYRQRISDAQNSRFRLCEFHDSFKAEWAALVEHKVETLTELERPTKGCWRATEHHSQIESSGLWYAFYNGLYVPTAHINWGKICNFLGWLTLENCPSSPKLAIDKVQTIGWLLSSRHLQSYVLWYVRRSGGKVHSGVTSFVLLVKMLTHPTTGYLTQSPHLESALPPEANISNWAAGCTAAFEWSKKTLKQLAPQKKKSRDPFEPIKDVLEWAHPMDAIGDMTQRMKAARPTTGGLTEAIWARDLLLIKLLASNPLRAKNIKLLTYKSDNSGQLYQTKGGAWRIYITPEFMKNENGAAKDTPYDMPVHESLWKDIERYLKRYRPLFPNADNLKYVFLSSEERKQAASWENLNRRVFTLTKCHLWHCPGVGPHAFRYIIGTTILKAQPGAWEVAAQVLHDKEETVRAHYAHLRGSDGAERAHALMNKAFERM